MPADIHAAARATFALLGAVQQDVAIPTALHLLNTTAPHQGRWRTVDCAGSCCSNVSWASAATAPCAHRVPLQELDAAAVTRLRVRRAVQDSAAEEAALKQPVES